MIDEKVARLRRADFWTSLLLLAVAAAMLKGALGFPITDSYGGVENVWYVSPALFPLLVAGALAFLSLVLLVNAIRTGGAAAALHAVSGGFQGLDAGQRKLALMGLLLVAYVYGFIPYIDYIVGTVFFLTAFITAFHLPETRAAVIAAFAFLTVGLSAAVVGALGLLPNPSTTAAYTLDTAVLLVLLVTAVAMVVTLGADRRRAVVVAGTAGLTPMLLAITFKYGLLVPLPREGVVVNLIDGARYALRAAAGG